MQHSLTEKGGDLVVSLQGDVDLDSSPGVRELLLQCVGRGATVFVDLSNVSYIDSSGVASFVEAFQIARRNGTAFGLVLSVVGRSAPEEKRSQVLATSTISVVILIQNAVL